MMIFAVIGTFSRPIEDFELSQDSNWTLPSTEAVMDENTYSFGFETRYLAISGILERLRERCARMSAGISSSSNRKIFGINFRGHIATYYSRPACIPRSAEKV